MGYVFGASEALDDFTHPNFNQWNALALAFDELGHTTRTYQNVRAWLQTLRDGLEDHTTEATRVRYLKILAAVWRLCGPPSLVRKMTDEEVVDEIAEVGRRVRRLDGADDDLVRDATLWWRAKLDGFAHHLGSKRTSEVIKALDQIGIERPRDRSIRVFPEWGPGVGEFEPQRQPVGGPWRSY